MKFDMFRRLLRDCFDPARPLLDNVAHHHAMVAFEKQPKKIEPTINKRTPLVGTAGPEKRKREDE